VWWCRPAFLVLRRLSKQGCEFNVSKKKKKKRKEKEIKNVESLKTSLSEKGFYVQSQHIEV
jgi:hypothetical protein